MKSPTYWQKRQAIEKLPGCPYPGAVCAPDNLGDRSIVKGMLSLKNTWVGRGTILYRGSDLDAMTEEGKRVNAWYLENDPTMTRATCHVAWDDRGYGWLSPKRVVRSRKEDDGTILHEVTGYPE